MYSMERLFEGYKYIILDYWKSGLEGKIFLGVFALSVPLALF